MTQSGFSINDTFMCQCCSQLHPSNENALVSSKIQLGTDQGLNQLTYRSLLTVFYEAN